MKRYYSEVSFKVEVEADTIEDAERLLYEWFISDVDGNDYVDVEELPPLIIKEMKDG